MAILGYEQDIESAGSGGDEERLLKKAASILEQVQQRYHQIDQIKEPAFYGMPDLMFERGVWAGTPTPENEGKVHYGHGVWFVESKEEFEIRQDKALKDMVEEYLTFEKDGSRRHIAVHKRMLDFMAELFFARVTNAIIWGPRGGGKTLGVAAVVWLVMVYRGLSWVDVAGSEQQAAQLYNYAVSFFTGIPKMNLFLVQKALRTRTSLNSGVELLCRPASESGVRGIHVPCVVCDEACQKDGASDKGDVMEAAIQGPLSEPEHMVILLSTFHIPDPDGFFARYWDGAEEKNFKKYRFRNYDTMVKCERGLKKEDGTMYAIDSPEAIEECRTCKLTRIQPILDQRGNVVARKKWGCWSDSTGLPYGSARVADGWQTYEAINEARILNAGSDKWATEHECERPNVGQRIFDPPSMIDAAMTDEPEYRLDVAPVVGLDWGYTDGHCAILFCAYSDSGIVVLDGRFTGHVAAEDVNEIIINFEKKWGFQEGDAHVWPDASQKPANIALARCGRKIQQVCFKKHKDRGLSNVQRYFGNGRIFITKRSVPGELEEQLRRYARNRHGRPNKQRDHGCDALLCALLAWNYSDQDWKGPLKTFQRDM